MGVFVGMILGAAIVAVAVWFFNRNDNPFTQTATTRQTPTDAPVAALPGKPGDRPVEKPDFTFFNTLPKGESAPVATPTGQAQPQPAPAPAQKPPEKTVYLQLGAFENAEQADDLKAQLLLMGLEPVTQRAQLPDGRIVHRIRIGPLTNREDVKAMRARLASNGFTADEVSSN
ncbi:MAG: SPOR domain-containing protein [Azoarcus sp.]|jgi:cell division protein FtsN|nr:SPOR domain-containing protein [Azoarcus sp.]